MAVVLRIDGRCAILIVWNVALARYLGGVVNTLWPTGLVLRPVVRPNPQIDCSTVSPERMDGNKRMTRGR